MQREGQDIASAQSIRQEVKEWLATAKTSEFDSFIAELSQALELKRCVTNDSGFVLPAVRDLLHCEPESDLECLHPRFLTSLPISSVIRRKSADSQAQINFATLGLLCKLKLKHSNKTEHLDVSDNDVSKFFLADIAADDSSRLNSSPYLDNQIAKEETNMSRRQKKKKELTSYNGINRQPYRDDSFIKGEMALLLNRKHFVKSERDKETKKLIFRRDLNLREQQLVNKGFYQVGKVCLHPHSSKNKFLGSFVKQFK